MGRSPRGCSVSGQRLGAQGEGRPLSASLPNSPPESGLPFHAARSSHFSWRSRIRPSSALLIKHTVLFRTMNGGTSTRHQCLQRQQGRCNISLQGCLPPATGRRRRWTWPARSPPAVNGHALRASRTHAAPRPRAASDGLDAHRRSRSTDRAPLAGRHVRPTGGLQQGGRDGAPHGAAGTQRRSDPGGGR